MDNIARFPVLERAELFGIVAEKRAMRPAIIEKDFWVCWALKRIFTLPSPPAAMIFKGGTSLSKAYQVIRRFSEDVDLSFQRADLGIDPAEEENLSARQRNELSDRIQAACVRTLQEKLLPQLGAAFAQELNAPAGSSWSLEMDSHNSTQVWFRYPGQQEPSYLKPGILLEFGARSDHWPHDTRSIQSYVAEDFPGQFQEPGVEVKVLAAKRTFWEKATILHKWHHADESRKIDRASRHYYDLAMMYRSDIGPEALEDLDLLAHVARHQEKLFYAAWARFDTAIPGTIRLIPQGKVEERMREDYQAMQEMFFDTPPTFDSLLSTLQELENEINR